MPNAEQIISNALDGTFVAYNAIEDIFECKRVGKHFKPYADVPSKRNRGVRIACEPSQDQIDSVLKLRNEGKTRKQIMQHFKSLNQYMSESMVRKIAFGVTNE